MKRTRKLILALVVVMSLLMAMAVAVIPASAKTYSSGGETVFFTPWSSWKSDGARFAARIWTNSPSFKEVWIDLKDTNNDGIYEGTIPEGTWDYVIFCRMNPNASANNWNNKWNQTGDISLPSDTKNHCTMGSSWDSASGSWAHRHIFGSTTNAKAETCEEGGNSAYKKCTVCNKYFAGGAAVTATGGKDDTSSFETLATGHNFDGGTTCVNVNNGVTCSFTCTHPETEIVLGSDASCTEDGLTNGEKCKACGCTVVEQETITAGDHNPSNPVVTAPTCTTGGYTTYTCTVCTIDYTDNEVEANGHGYNDNGICSVCGYNRDYAIVFFSNEWLWTDVSVHYWGSEVAADTTWPGVKATLFENNGTYDIYYVLVPRDATAIIFNGVKDDGTEDRDQTPDINDYTDCDAYKIHWNGANAVSKIDYDKHVPVEFDRQDATCTEDGLVRYACACGQEYSEEVLDAHHTYSSDCDTTCDVENCNGTREPLAQHTPGAAATCTTAQTCTVCDAVLVPALGHNHNDCPHQASIDGTYYDTFEKALEAAKKDDTIFLNKDYTLTEDIDTEAAISLNAGVTLNLNGKTLTALGVLDFGDATLVDEIGGGKIVVLNKGIHNYSSNANLPVRVSSVENEDKTTTDTYVLAKVTDQYKGDVVDGNYVIQFRPMFDGIEHFKLFADGSEDNDVAFFVRITGLGDIDVPVNVIKAAFNGAKPLAIKLTLKNAAPNTTYTIQLVMKVGTDSEYVGKLGTINADGSYTK